MRYHALAVDYDGTLARDGEVDEATVAALRQLRDSGRRLLLVTGRELPSLQRDFPQLDLFDQVVAENGALLYTPSAKSEEPLAEPPPEKLVQALRERGVCPLSVGAVVVATWTPHETAVLETIRELGLEHQVIFNKGAVMVLPPNLNKATGLSAALRELGLSPHNVVAVGDAENDHAFLRLCECAVAVANGLPSLQEEADLVTEGEHGAGVRELIDRLLADDLAGVTSDMERHRILIGTAEDGAELGVPAYGPAVLVAGSEGSGKSTLTTGILERLAEGGYQFCLIDPEGDYENLEPVIYLGGPDTPPDVTETLEALQRADESVAVSLLGLPLQDRPGFFEGLLPQLQSMRAQFGRPHWIFVDEAHHMLPAGWERTAPALPQELSSLLLITVHPEHVSPAVLATVGIVIAVGRNADQTIAAFCDTIGETPPTLSPTDLPSGEVLVWRRQDGRGPVRVKIAPGKTERRRHRRKYMQGNLLEEEHFRFRGPNDELDIPAQNLQIFMQIGEGVDEATWLFHLRRHDYSEWFARVIKDEALADDARRVESQPDISAEESRGRLRGLIEERYTLPA